jgi:hypothetical protein
MSSAEDLRGYLGRLLGWANTSAIDHALRSIELAREHRAQLVLCGHGDLVSLAYGQHRRALGANTPFIVCDPRRGNTHASVRSPANASRWYRRRRATARPPPGGCHGPCHTLAARRDFGSAGVPIVGNIAALRRRGRMPG